MQHTVILVNLGTPAGLSRRHLRRYLRTFLCDPRVIDLNPLLRFLLVYGIIAPLRPFKILKAYRAIWQSEGSPLLVQSQKLAQRIAEHLPPGTTVRLAMRYGEPSLAAAFRQLVPGQRVSVVPLYPQYAASTTGSTIAEVYRQAGRLWDPPVVRFLPPFFGSAYFVHALAVSLREVLAQHRVDHILFSYHGIPVRHLTQSDCEAAAGSCMGGSPCPESPERATCYRQQCYQTSAAVMAELAIELPYSVAFQSRLGSTPWIRPYTDQHVTELRRDRGVSRLAVLCPSFVADCLETLEEVGIRLREQWIQQLGGEFFVLIPCVAGRRDFAAGLAGAIAQLP